LPLVHKPPSGGGSSSRTLNFAKSSGLSTDEGRAPIDYWQSVLFGEADQFARCYGDLAGIGEQTPIWLRSTLFDRRLDMAALPTRIVSILTPRACAAATA
jgi:hypothetical protein